MRITESQLRRIIRQEVRSLTEAGTLFGSKQTGMRPSRPWTHRPTRRGEIEPTGEVSYSGPAFQVIGHNNRMVAEIGDGDVEMNALEFDGLAEFCKKQRETTAMGSRGRVWVVSVNPSDPDAKSYELDPISSIWIKAFPNGFKGPQGEVMSFEASGNPDVMVHNFRDAAAFLSSIPGASFKIYTSI